MMEDYSLPHIQARLDQIAAEPDAVFDLAYYGSFYIEVDEDGSMRYMPYPTPFEW
jgi:hypothetical protein